MIIPSDREYMKALEQVVVHPIFILGMHRSGTSILYKMLADTKAVNLVTAYDIIKSDELLANHFQRKEAKVKKELTDFFIHHGAEDRGIDRLLLTADFAEEYGFFLGRYTFQMKLTKQTLPYFDVFLKKIQLISENTQPILLKNPFDFDNFLAIKKWYPQAKFIFIHRHPYDTLSSTIKALQFLLQKNNPYISSLSRLFTKFYKNRFFLSLLRLWFIALSFFALVYLTIYSARVSRYYLRHISQLPPDDYIVITYEHLCAHPQETMKNIQKFLQLTSKHHVDFQSYIKPRLPLLNSRVLMLHKFIYRCMKPYFDAFGYSPEVSVK